MAAGCVVCNRAHATGDMCDFRACIHLTEQGMGDFEWAEGIDLELSTDIVKREVVDARASQQACVVDQETDITTLEPGEPIAIGVARDIHAIDDLHTRCLKLCRALAHERDDGVAFCLELFCQFEANSTIGTGNHSNRHDLSVLYWFVRMTLD